MFLESTPLKCTRICTCTVFNADHFCWRRRLLLPSPLSANAQLWWRPASQPGIGKWCGSSALQRFFLHQLDGVGIQLLLLLQLFAHFTIFPFELWKFMLFSQQNCFHWLPENFSLTIWFWSLNFSITSFCRLQTSIRAIYLNFIGAMITAHLFKMLTILFSCTVFCSIFSASSFSLSVNSRFSACDQINYVYLLNLHWHRQRHGCNKCEKPVNFDIN